MVTLVNSFPGDEGLSPIISTIIAIGFPFSSVDS
uniref:Uncharacterized protein n=1 Tax=candidate division WOR-3 bacterium TaxID=2052148 RepID=A0A7V4CIG3_UNCW3